MENNERVNGLKWIFSDPDRFCTYVLGFKPTNYQKDLIKKFMENQFVAARWSRQSGKSHIVSALLLWYALVNQNSYIAVVGPSWRQTKLVIRKINAFLPRLPKKWYHKPLKTIIRLKNGSTIEAFPNNPDTIRGPTLDVVYADEFNFISNDEEMYDAILFTLGTTNGKFICSSTPWNTDSVFYKIFNHEDYSDFARSHVTWKDAIEPEGPLKSDILEKIRRQLRADPWRWRREMEADWAEDESVWLPQSLITKCIGTVKTLGYDLEYFEYDKDVSGEFYVGEDFGKHRDHSVISVIERKGEQILLRHCNQFKLKTPYASVIGYTKVLCDHWKYVRRALLDKTGLGDYIVEDTKNSGIPGVEGINFTEPKKEEIATALKQAMVDGRFWIPFDTELINELNIERFELTKAGKIRFSHPEGTHDDRFWATALSVYAATVGREEPSRLVRAF